jgi:hypothetical protein
MSVLALLQITIEVQVQVKVVSAAARAARSTTSPRAAVGRARISIAPRGYVNK